MVTLKDTLSIKGHPAALPTLPLSHFILLPTQHGADWTKEKQEV